MNPSSFSRSLLGQLEKLRANALFTSLCQLLARFRSEYAFTSRLASSHTSSANVLLQMDTHPRSVPRCFFTHPCLQPFTATSAASSDSGQAITLAGQALRLASLFANPKLNSWLGRTTRTLNPSLLKSSGDLSIIALFNDFSQASADKTVNELISKGRESKAAKADPCKPTELHFINLSLQESDLVGSPLPGLRLRASSAVW